MNSLLRDSFDRHSQNYGDRVADRETYAYLDVEDKIIASFVNRNWPESKTGTLVDAACGTGDRLRMLFERNGLPNHFTEIVGIDYAPNMLAIARTQKIGEAALYTDTRTQDLLETSPAMPRSDLTLCLWEVINTNGKNAYQLVRGLGETLNEGGYLIYDVLTMAMSDVMEERQAAVIDRLDLERSDDPQQFWYEHDDGTVAHERLFTLTELNKLLGALCLTTVEAWGYDDKDLVPQELNVHDGQIDEPQAAKLSSILVFQQRQQDMSSATIT